MDDDSILLSSSKYNGHDNGQSTVGHPIPMSLISVPIVGSYNTVLYQWRIAMLCWSLLHRFRSMTGCKHPPHDVDVIWRAKTLYGLISRVPRDTCCPQTQIQSGQSLYQDSRFKFQEDFVLYRNANYCDFRPWRKRWLPLIGRYVHVTFSGRSPCVATGRRVVSDAVVVGVFCGEWVILCGKMPSLWLIVVCAERLGGGSGDVGVVDDGDGAGTETAQPCRWRVCHSSMAAFWRGQQTTWTCLALTFGVLPLGRSGLYHHVVCWVLICIEASHTLL